MLQFRLRLPVLLLALAALCGCPNSGPGQNAADSNEILIGHYASMTGSEATFGQSTDNGIKLAVEEINAAGGINGKQIKLITYDDKGDTKETGATVTRLITRDQVVAVLGEVQSTLSLAGAPVCQENGVPMISPSSTNPRVTEVGDKIFRVCFIDPFQGYVCAKFAREHESVKAEKIAVLYDQSSAYSKGLAEEFEKAFTSLGGKVTENQAYNKGDQDFTAQLTAIRSTDPDMIFVPGYYTDVGNIAIQARQLGIDVPLFGGDGWDSSHLFAIARRSTAATTEPLLHEDPSPRPGLHRRIKPHGDP
jgi:branched-chain amino acid transport system substrate-binding protein